MTSASALDEQLTPLPDAYVAVLAEDASEIAVRQEYRPRTARPHERSLLSEMG